MKEMSKFEMLRKKSEEAQNERNREISKKKFLIMI